MSLEYDQMVFLIHYYLWDFSRIITPDPAYTKKDGIN